MLDTRTKGSPRPIVEVKLYDTRINDETVPKLIEKITDAVVECTSEGVRDLTHVVVEGIPAKQWGTAGKPHA
jgi:4-oxalocrotonate tautomerase